MSEIEMLKDENARLVEIYKMQEAENVKLRTEVAQLNMRIAESLVYLLHEGPVRLLERSNEANQ